MRRNIGAVLVVSLAVAALPAHGADNGEAKETKSGFVAAAVSTLARFKGKSPSGLLDSEIIDISMLAGKKLLEGKKHLNNKGWFFTGGASFKPGNIVGFTAEMQEEAKGEVAAAVGTEVGADVFAPVSGKEIVTNVGASCKLVVNSASRSLGVEFSGGFTRTVRGKGYDVRIERVLVLEQLYPDAEAYQKAMPRFSEDTDLLKMGMTKKVMDVLTGEQQLEDFRADQATSAFQKIQKQAAVADTDILKFDRTRVSFGYRMVLLTPQGLPVPDPAKVLSKKDLAKLIPAQLSGGITYMTHYEQAGDQPIGSGDVYGSIGRNYNFTLGSEKIGVNIGVAKSGKKLKFGRETTDEHLQMLRLANMIQTDNYEGFEQMIKGEAMPLIYTEKVRKALALLKKFGKAVATLDPSRLVANGVVINYNPDLLTSGRPPGEVARLLAELADNYEAKGNSFMLQAGPGRRRLKVISLRKLLAGPAAKTVGDLTRIRGYIVDPGGDMLLIGEADRHRPRIDINVLYVAAQSILSADSQYALVSLDPDPNDMEGPHKVRIEGLPEKLRNTEYTRIMIEADYQMKRVNHGDVPVAAPGFKSAYQLVSEQSPAGVRFSRYWLKPYQSRVADIWEHQQGDRKVVMFDSRVLVMTENMQKVGGFLRQTGKPDPLCERAASLFTEHYSAIAEQEEIFHKLAAVFDATKLCSIWRHKGVKHPVIDDLLSRDVETVAIKDAYPGLKAKDVLVGVMDADRGPTMATLRLVGGASAELKLTDKSFMDKPLLAGLLKAGAGDSVRVRLPATTMLTPQQLNDQSVDMQLGRGLHMYSNLEFDEALKALDRAIELDPQCTPAYIYRGMSRMGLGRKAEALQDIDRVVAAEPMLKGLRAWLRALSGDVRGALEDAAAAEKQFPRQEAVLSPCAFARFHAFDLSGAERALHKAMDLNPTDKTLIGLQATLVALNSVGPAEARKRLDLINAMSVQITDAHATAAASLQTMDFEDAVTKATLCLKLIAESPDKQAAEKLYFKERAMMVLAMAYSAQATMQDIMGPEQGGYLTDQARRQWDELIQLRPDWTLHYLMKANMLKDDSEALDQAIRAFYAAAAKPELDDPLLDELKATTGNDRALAWLGLVLSDRLPRRGDRFKPLLRKIVAMLGDSQAGRLLAAGDPKDGRGDLNTLRQLHAKLPEKLVDPDQADIWCVTLFCRLLAKGESKDWEPERAVKVVKSYLRMTNIEGLDLASVQLVAACGMALAHEHYGEAYKPSFESDPRLQQLRGQLANGEIDLAEMKSGLDAIQETLRAKVEGDLSKVVAAFLNMTKITPARLKAERGLLKEAEQYVEIDARNDAERQRLTAVIRKWREDIEKRDPKKGKASDEHLLATLAGFVDAAETTVEIHAVQLFIDPMLKASGMMAQQDPAVAEKMLRVMTKLQRRLRAKTVTVKRKKLSWEGWPTVEELMAGSVGE